MENGRIQEEGTDDNCNHEDDDSEVQIIDSRPFPRPPAEIIDLAVDDHSSDDDEDCFWERDALGNIKKEAVSLNCNYADVFDDECSDSDEDSSSIEDVTEQIMAKRKTEVKERLDKAEEIYDSDDEEDTNIPAD